MLYTDSLSDTGQNYYLELTENNSCMATIAQSFIQGGRKQACLGSNNQIFVR